MMRYIKFILTAVIGFSLLASCTKDDGEGGSADTADEAANRWAYKIMQDSYLWRDQMPSSPNFDREYDYFFKSLLSLEDGKPVKNEDGVYSGFYSSIRKYVGSADTTATRAKVVEYLTSSYGFDYTLTQSFLYDERVSQINRYAKIYATVAWVTKGSQAQKDGLKRGDHIYKVNGTEFPQQGYGELLANLHAPTSGSATVTFTVCKLTQVTENGEPVFIEGTDNNGNVYDVPLVTRDDENTKNFTLTSDFISETPVFYAKPFESGSKKVGYLLYNQFYSGTNYTKLNGEELIGKYDEDLRTTFDDFKSKGITDLIVDLRYNPGGQLSSCQLLASLIASSLANSTFCELKYVDGKSDSQVKYLSEPSAVNMSNVYIIATHNSASASEVLLHCLRASGINVYHIGTATEGKNVGQTVHSTETLGSNSGEKKAMGRYNYLLYPVTFRIVDSKGGTYPSSGIDPAETGGYEFDETFVVDFKNFDDPEEPMIALALHHIENGSWPVSTRVSQSTRSGTFGSVRGNLGKGVPRHYKPTKGIIEGGY